MAIPLKKFAERCESMAIQKGAISPLTSASVSLYDISRDWRRLHKATDFKSDSFEGWSEKEECAANLIISTLVYLRRIKCRDVEKLLREKLDNQCSEL